MPFLTHAFKFKCLRQFTFFQQYFFHKKLENLLKTSKLVILTLEVLSSMLYKDRIKKSKIFMFLAVRSMENEAT